MKIEIWNYSHLFLKRLYSPLKPIITPLTQKIKLVNILEALLGISLIGILWPVPAVYKSQERVSQWPWSSRSHTQMALTWLENGNETEAIRELKIGNDLQIIKTKSSQNNLKKTESKIREPEKIRQEIILWEKILKEKPYYRDVLLRLTILNYRLYENEKALKYWKKANYLDPNNEAVKGIGEIINQSEN